MHLPSPRRSRTWLGAAAIFVAALLAFGILFQSFPVLYDTDSYYHLAIARTYARHGIVDSLPWAQLSLLHEFGDKELLFHAVLAPFADTADATAGGRWALAGLNALLAAVLAFLGARAVGPWGLAAPLLVYAGSIDFLGRAIRLRPEILSLLLLLAAVVCAGRRRYRWLGVVAALYALSYTAFHAFLGLAVLWFAYQLWAHGRREWGLLLYPFAGVGAGLVLHPHFPRNLVVWKVQSVDFFQQKRFLNVGAEIGAHGAPDLIWLNLAWILGLAVLWLSAERRRNRRDDPTSDALWVTTFAFGALYVLMLRFSIYFVPFATLAVLYEIRRRGARLTAFTRLPWRAPPRVPVRLPLAAALAAVLALGLPRTVTLLRGLAETGGSIAREVEWRAFGRSLPPGARVAAEWGSTHIYMFWAPQATFLNVLDPVFMNVRYPEAYRTLRAIFEGREPDVPRALKTGLGCDYLALSRFHRPAGVLRRLAADPRLRLRHDGYTLLYEIADGGAGRFVRDWRAVPRGVPVPPALASIDDLAPYPRAPAELRHVEGYVSVNEPSCAAFVHVEEVAGPVTRLYELAPYGPTRVWIDDRLAVATAETLGARLDGGLSFFADFAPGTRRVTVLTCPGSDGGAPGFYLVDRGAGREDLEAIAPDPR